MAAAGTVMASPLPGAGHRRATCADPSTTPMLPDGLEALEQRARREIALLAYPDADWVAPVTAQDGQPALDCAIIGAGQYGLALGAALRRERIGNVTLFDAADPGREGPWASFARMQMLRTPKDLTGPDGGIPSLTFRAWWEAQHGAASWESMYRAPRLAWAEYLLWLRRVFGLQVQNGWRLVGLVPVEQGRLLRLTFATPSGEAVRHARSVVMATGAGGSGGHAVPAEIARAVPPGRVLHANDPFDAALLSGQRIGILGGGASGFDVAIAALEAGAASAEVCIRRPGLPRDNPRRWMETAGFLGHYVDLPDQAKWSYARRLRSIGQPPPQPSFDAAMALPGFRLRTGMPWDCVRWTGDAIVVEGEGKRAAYDRVVIATGFLSDMSLLPEWAEVQRHAALWRDRFQPLPEEADARLGRLPYLDRNGAFQPRIAGQAEWLSRVLTITGHATLSLGPLASSISAMRHVLPRLVDGVRRQLFLDQQERTWSQFVTGDHAELRPFDLPEAEAA
jgi:cation diffusion facilitator CzcD-associated flavoprotein CzcO